MTLAGPRESLLRLTRRYLRRGGPTEVPESLLTYFHDTDSWGHAARALGGLVAGQSRRAACHVRLGLSAYPPRPLRTALLAIGVEAARRAGLARRERLWDAMRRESLGWSRPAAHGANGHAVLATVAPALAGTEAWYGSDAVRPFALSFGLPRSAAAGDAGEQARASGWAHADEAALAFATGDTPTRSRGGRSSASGPRGAGRSRGGDTGSGVMLHLVIDPYRGELVSAPVGFAVKVSGGTSRPVAQLWLRLPPATFPASFPDDTTWRVRLADASRAWDFRQSDGTLHALEWDGQEVRVRLEVPPEWKAHGPNPAMLFGAVHDVVVVPGGTPATS